MTETDKNSIGKSQNSEFPFTGAHTAWQKLFQPFRATTQTKNPDQPDKIFEDKPFSFGH